MKMVRKLMMASAIAASLAGSLTTAFAQVIIYDPPNTGTSSQPSNSPSGGGMDRPYNPE
jgi:hypothetical protein